VIARSCSIASLFFLKISLFPGKKQGLSDHLLPIASNRQCGRSAEQIVNSASRARASGDGLSYCGTAATATTRASVSGAAGVMRSTATDPEECAQMAAKKNRPD
jgi:hypothetical protein